MIERKLLKYLANTNFYNWISLNDMNLCCMAFLCAALLYESIQFCLCLYIACEFKYGYKNDCKYPAWFEKIHILSIRGKLDLFYLYRFFYKNKPELQQAFSIYTQTNVDEFKIHYKFIYLILPLFLGILGWKYDDIVLFLASILQN